MMINPQMYWQLLPGLVTPLILCVCSLKLLVYEALSY